MISHLCWPLARSYKRRKRACCSSAVWCFLSLSAAASSTSSMKFDNVLAEVNGFGKFQIRTMLLLVIPRVTLPFHFLLNNFIASIPAHHCAINSLDDGGTFGNLSQQEKLVVSIPFQQDGSPSSCQMFAEPQYHLLFNSTNTTDLPAVPCQSGWTYDNTTFKSTLATEVCSLKTSFYDWGQLFMSDLSVLGVSLKVGPGLWEEKHEQSNSHHLLHGGNGWSSSFWLSQWQVWKPVT